MDTPEVERALARVGTRMRWHTDVEILLVGGAAGMVTGVLARGRTTIDCDVMVYEPESAWGEVEAAADSVAAEMGLAPGWLNSHVRIRRDSLPDGWRERRVLVGVWGRLRVWAASRVDLIAMKVLAGRDVDIDDLQAMDVRGDECVFVRAFLDGAGGRGTSGAEIEMARRLLAALESGDGV